MRVKMAIPVDSKPGQIYDANLQCELMHGPGYQQVKATIVFLQLILLENCFGRHFRFPLKRSWKRPFARREQRDFLEINILCFPDHPQGRHGRRHLLHDVVWSVDLRKDHHLPSCPGGNLLWTQQMVLLGEMCPLDLWRRRSAHCGHDHPAALPTRPDDPAMAPGPSSESGRWLVWLLLLGLSPVWLFWHLWLHRSGRHPSYVHCSVSSKWRRRLYRLHPASIRLQPKLRCQEQ